MQISVVEGDLLDQRADAIVNPWNRNILPWWLLLPQGVSGAILKRAGPEPFRELARQGPLRLGGAIATTAGRLPYQGIIHVAGINLLWRSSESSIRTSLRSALALAAEKGWRLVAVPLIGAGTGGGSPEVILGMLQDEAAQCFFDGEVRIVVFSGRSPSR